MSKKNRSKKNIVAAEVTPEAIVPQESMSTEIVAVVETPVVSEPTPEVVPTIEVEVVDEVPAIIPSTPEAPVAQATPIVATKQLSKVARIDQLWMEKGMSKGNAQIIATIIAAEYPTSDAKSTLNTIRCRPWHLRQKGFTIGSSRAKQVQVAVVETPAPVTTEVKADEPVVQAS